MISSLFLPPLVISKVGCKKTLAAALFTHTIYIAANFYPKPFIFYPAAILLGVGIGFRSVSIIIYVIYVSQAYAQALGKAPTYFTRLFFGILYAFVNFGSFSGAFVMSMLLKSFGRPNTRNELNINTTIVSESRNETYLLQGATTPAPFENSSSCGLHYDVTEEGMDQQTSIPQHTLHILLGVYVVLSTIPTVLCMLLKDIDEEELESKSVCKKSDKEESVNATEVENVIASTCDSLNKIHSDSTSKKSVFLLLRSTLHLLVTDKVALLVVSHTIHVGVLKAFSRSVFNAAWISCWLGIEYVGYVMAAYSIILTVVSFLSGYILKVVTFEMLFGLVMLVEVSTCGALYIWKPSQDDIVVYYAVMCIFAFCYGIVKTQTPSAYDKLFADQKEQAAALQGVMEAMGLSLMFGLSGFIHPISSLSVFLAFSFLGCVLFVFGCLIKDKQFRYWTCFKASVNNAKL